MKVPIAVGEQFGPKWDWNELIEQHLTDYARATIPNVGGITEFQKIAAIGHAAEAGDPGQNRELDAQSTAAAPGAKRTPRAAW